MLNRYLFDIRFISERKLDNTTSDFFLRQPVCRTIWLDRKKGAGGLIAFDALKGPEENAEWKLAPEDNVAQNRKMENNAKIVTIHSYNKAMWSD